MSQDILIISRHWGIFAGKCLTTFLLCLDIAAPKIQANVAQDCRDRYAQAKCRAGSAAKTSLEDCPNPDFLFYVFGFAGHAGGRYVQKYTWIQGKEIVQLLLKQYGGVYGTEALLAMFERVVKIKTRALGRV